MPPNGIDKTGQPPHSGRRFGNSKTINDYVRAYCFIINGYEMFDFAQEHVESDNSYVFGLGANRTRRQSPV